MVGRFGPPPLYFSYKFPLENSLKVSKQVYYAEMHTNNSNHCSTHERCSIEEVFHKCQNGRQLNPTFSQNL